MILYLDGTSGGTLARLLAPNPTGGKRSSLGRNTSLSLGESVHNSPTITGQAESLAQDMADLMHDFDVVSRVASMIGSMR